MCGTLEVIRYTAVQLPNHHPLIQRQRHSRAFYDDLLLLSLFVLDLDLERFPIGLCKSDDGYFVFVEVVGGLAAEDDAFGDVGAGDGQAVVRWLGAAQAGEWGVASGEWGGASGEWGRR
jgi:hypothetical protein